jgi:hypothetical protein
MYKRLILASTKRLISALPLKNVTIILSSLIITIYFSKYELFTLAEIYKIKFNALTSWDYIYFALNSSFLSYTHFIVIAVLIISLCVNDIANTIYLIRVGSRKSWFFNKVALISEFSILYPLVYIIVSITLCMVIFGLPNLSNLDITPFSKFNVIEGIILLYICRIFTMIIMGMMYLFIYTLVKKVTVAVGFVFIYFSYCTLSVYTLDAQFLKRYAIGAAISLKFMETGSLSQNLFSIFVVGGLILMVLSALTYYKINYYDIVGE